MNLSQKFSKIIKTLLISMVFATSVSLVSACQPLLLIDKQGKAYSKLSENHDSFAFTNPFSPVPCGEVYYVKYSLIIMGVSLLVILALIISLRRKRLLNKG